jgi:hypothetical protein
VGNDVPADWLAHAHIREIRTQAQSDDIAEQVVGNDRRLLLALIAEELRPVARLTLMRIAAALAAVRSRYRVTTM